MTRSPLVGHLEIEGWQDHLLIGSLMFIAVVLLIFFLRGGGPRGH